MKNLKKILALVLAFACAFTMFAGAAFTDVADIKTSEAVDMLSALGVIKGYSDGSFKPDATITRAEAAKMIYTIRNGGNDNADTFKGKSNFTDVYSGHWAEGYINFCYTNGIINGKSATKFAPEDSVTGTELAKMLLICMGYQAQKSGLTGTGYSQRTNALASQNGLLDNVTAAMGVAFPRQYAAQMMYNALDADTVQWSTDVNDYEKVKSTGLEWRANADGSAGGSWVSVTKNETMGKKWMKLDTQEGGIVTAVEKEDGKDTYKVSTTAGDYTKVISNYSNLIGQKVKVMIKDNKADQVYGIYADDDSKVLVTGVVGDMEKVSSDSKKIKLDGTEYKLDYARDAFSIYNFNKDTSSTTVDTYTATKTASLAAASAANEIRLIDNDGNGKADRIVMTPRTVNEVTYVGSSNFSLQGVGTIKNDDCASIYDGMAKDDWALYVDGDYTVSGDHEVSKAEMVNAEVNGIKGSTGEFQVRVDGKWYYLTAGMSQLDSGTNYDFVVVGGVIFDADEAEASSKDVLVVADVDNGLNGGFSASGSTQDVKAYFMDGSNKTITVEKLNNTTSDVDPSDVKDTNKLNSASDIGKLYTFTTKSNGNYELNLLSATNKAGYKKVETDSSNGVTKNNKIVSKAVADDAVVFVIYGSDLDVKVISGKTVNDWSSTYTYGKSAMAATKDSNGIEYVKVAAIRADARYSGAGSDYNYGYLTTSPYTSSKNPDGSSDKCTAFEIWNGTEDVTLYTDGTVSTSLKTGDVLIYTNDGQYIDVETSPSDIKIERAAVYGFDYKKEGNIVFNTSSKKDVQYKLDEDCVFLAVNDDDNKGVGNDMNQLIKAEPNKANTAYLANAWIVYDTEDKVVAIVFDVENNQMGSEIYY